MRVAIALPQVPFVRGGAEFMADELCRQLRLVGHQAEIITIPFRFSSDSRLLESVQQWSEQDFNCFDIGAVDRVIALKFPAYFLKHPNLKVWLLHQNRASYELSNEHTTDHRSVHQEIKALDSRCLAECGEVFVISDTVGRRLKANNRIDSTTIYPPPPRAEDYGPGLVYPYIFFPSRLELLKRQDLLIRAMSLTRAPVNAVIAGEGGMCEEYAALVHSLGLSDRIRFVGGISHQAKVELYRNALAVCFVPFDEDYGFVAPEAMLCEKPVITCHDSGGPTEFVVDGETGFVVAPDPESVAQSIDWLWDHKSSAIEMGIAGRERYNDMNISWKKALTLLLR